MSRGSALSHRRLHLHFSRLSLRADFADGPDGNPVNALHGFARFLGDLIERVEPSTSPSPSMRRSSPRFAIGFSRPTRRIANLRLPISNVSSCCVTAAVRGLGVAHFASSEYEADDIVGTLATRMRAPGRKIVLVTRDKDLSQLVRPGDEYWDYIGDKRFGYDDIADRFGVLPERMACFLAVMGDAVDNIPGVPGIGRKTASLLFRTSNRCSISTTISIAC